MSDTPTGKSAGGALAERLEACRSIGDFLALWFEHPILPAAQQRVFDAHYADYRRHFPPRMRALYARQTDELIALVRARPGCRMLEIGSGSGSESLWAAMLGACVLGVDVRADRVAVARARQDVVERALARPLDCRFEVRSLFDLTGETFDVIWMEQALHHVEPREAAIDRMVTLLAPGGRIVVSEANAANPLLQLQLLLRRGWRTRTTFVDDAGQEHPYGNERVLRAATLVRALERRGVRCESVRHFRIFPNHPLFDGTRRIEARLEHLQLTPLFTHYNYVGRRNT